MPKDVWVNQSRFLLRSIEKEKKKKKSCVCKNKQVFPSILFPEANL